MDVFVVVWFCRLVKVMKEKTRKVLKMLCPPSLLHKLVEQAKLVERR